MPCGALLREVFGFAAVATSRRRSDAAEES